MRRSIIAILVAGALAGAACGSVESGSPTRDAAATTALATTTAEATTTTLAPITTTAATTTVAPATTTTPAILLAQVEERAPEESESDNGSGVGRIEIPRLGVDQRLQNNWDLATLDYGPGLMPGSPRPGQMGNMVVAGHRTSYSRPFRYIDTLKTGDEVVFTIEDKRYVYHVTDHLVVNPDAMWITNPTAEATATLFACHPPGSTAQRWVTRLVLVSG